MSACQQAAAGATNCVKRILQDWAERTGAGSRAASDDGRSRAGSGSSSPVKISGGRGSSGGSGDNSAPQAARPSAAAPPQPQLAAASFGAGDHGRHPSQGPATSLGSSGSHALLSDRCTTVAAAAPRPAAAAGDGMPAAPAQQSGQQRSQQWGQPSWARPPAGSWLQSSGGSGGGDSAVDVGSPAGAPCSAPQHLPRIAAPTSCLCLAADTACMLLTSFRYSVVTPLHLLCWPVMRQAGLLQSFFFIKGVFYKVFFNHKPQLSFCHRRQAACQAAHPAAQPPRRASLPLPARRRRRCRATAPRPLWRTACQRGWRRRRRLPRQWQVRRPFRNMHMLDVVFVVTEPGR